MRRLDLIFLDLFLIAVATVCALVLRENFDVSQERLAALVPYLLVTIAIAVCIIPAFGINRSVWRFTSTSDCLRILFATVATVISAVAISFALNRLEGIARALPILQALLIASLLIGVRVLLVLRHVARGKVPRSETLHSTDASETILIVGYGKMTELFVRSIAEFAPGRVRVAGILGHHERHIGRTLHGYTVLGTPQQTVRVLQDLEVHGVVVDRIVVCTAFENLVREAQAALLKVERTTEIALDFLPERMGLDANGCKPNGPQSPASLKGKRRSLSSFSAIDLEALAQHPYWRVKRGFDILTAVALLVIFSPVILLVAALVVLDVGPPALFWQQRPGWSRQPFHLYKFRTMAPAHNGHGRRVPENQRLSSIGRLLRRLRLDELPQLYNILVGEMSFVGPRPLLLVDQPEADATRLLVRPGLTGWAQVHGGRELTVSEKAALDLWYIKHASLRLDARILLQTAVMLVRGENPNQAVIQSARFDLGIASNAKSGAAVQALGGAAKRAVV